MEDKKQVPITLEAQRDITWFIKFLPQYNGLTFFDQKPVNYSIELDAIRVWQDQWRDKKVGIACDNWAVVQVLNIGRTRDLTLAAIARNIQYQAAVSNIHLQVTHIPGKKNIIADLLSRWKNTVNPHSLLKFHLPNFAWVKITQENIDIDWSI